MERNRQPSTTSSINSAHESIRRRSGKLGHASDDSDSVSPTRGCKNTSLDRSVPAEDENVIKRRPTVLLVNPLHSSRRHPSGPHLLPHTASLVASASVPLDGRTVVHRNSDGFMEISAHHIDPHPLNPVNDISRCETSHFSTYDSNRSSESLISLPTPNLSAASTRSLSMRSILPSHLSFLSFGGAERPPSATFTTVTPHPSQNVRSDSNYLTSSMGTSDVSCCSNSIDSGRVFLIPSINTTGKFTDKWPKPRSFRTLSTDESGSTETKSLGPTEAVRLLDDQGTLIKNDEKWTIQKWCLLLSVASVFVCGVACLTCVFMAWFRVWPQADVMYTVDNDVLVISTLTGSLLVFAALIGITGVLLHSRSLLATYAIILWPGLVSIVVVGYITYKRSTFALDLKLDSAWSQWYTSEGRLLIQDVLHCCGYYDALHDAVPSKRCYPRTPLPGCKGPLYRFEKEILDIIWNTSFSLVPLQILNITVALLCANHVTNPFGDGIMPKHYRMSVRDLNVDAERISAHRGGMYVVRPPGYSSLISEEDKNSADE